MNNTIMNDANEILSLNKLYTNYNDRFLRFARSYVSNYEIAEDIVMDSFMYYWENRVNLTFESNIPVYLLTVIKHKCLNHLQRLRRRREIEEYLQQTDTWELDLKISTLEACNPEKLFSDEVQKIVKETIASFPEQTREIFIRSRFKNQSHKEIAEELGLSTKSVEYHITKSLRVLRVALKDYFPVILAMSKFMG